MTEAQTIAQTIDRVARALQAANALLVTAESCTGGWIAKACTDRAGSSAWFERAYVTYSNAAKRECLGVPADVLARHGAVSGPVAEAMAAGALRHSRAKLSLAVTGIAGPDGGSAEKPVGTVWFAWADSNLVASEVVHFSGDRDAVRRQTVVHALSGLLQRFALPLV